MPDSDFNFGDDLNEGANEDTGEGTTKAPSWVTKVRARNRELNNLVKEQAQKLAQYENAGSAPASTSNKGTVDRLTQARDNATALGLPASYAELFVSVESEALPTRENLIRFTLDNNLARVKGSAPKEEASQEAAPRHERWKPVTSSVGQAPEHKISYEQYEALLEKDPLEAHRQLKAGLVEGSAELEDR